MFTTISTKVYSQDGTTTVTQVDLDAAKAEVARLEEEVRTLQSTLDAAKANVDRLTASIAAQSAATQAAATQAEQDRATSFSD